MFSQHVLSTCFVKILQTWKSNNNNKDMYRTALHALAFKNILYGLYRIFLSSLSRLSRSRLSKNVLKIPFMIEGHTGYFYLGLSKNVLRIPFMIEGHTGLSKKF